MIDIMRKRTSLKDIAVKVGVSTALVSYVLNGRMEGRINKDVAQKIRDTALKLQYQPNHMARSLKTNRSGTIGLIVADISNPFSSGLARIIEDEADKLGYTVIFGSSDESEERSGKLITTLINRQVDGLIILPPDKAEKQIRNLKAQGIPFVLVDRYFPGISCDSVCIDNYQAAFDATEHLLSNGRQRIGMIGYRSGLVHLNDRIEGYRAALAAKKIRPRKQWLQQVAITNDKLEIETAVQSLLLPGKQVDAMLFGSNSIATAALKYIQSLKIQVPDDLCLVAFDQSDLFDFFYAPLTHVSQPLMQMGQEAVRLLIETISGKPGPRRLRLPATLVVRDSSSIN